MGSISWLIIVVTCSMMGNPIRKIKMTVTVVKFTFGIMVLNNNIIALRVIVYRIAIPREIYDSRITVL